MSKGKRYEIAFLVFLVLPICACNNMQQIHSDASVIDTNGDSATIDTETVEDTETSDNTDADTEHTPKPYSLLWAKQSLGPARNYGHSIAVAPDGSVFVTGSSGDTVSFGLGEVNQTELFAEGWLECLLGQIQWRRHFGMG